MSPSRGAPVSISAVSGISGSISIACWIVVFSPQIIENFRRSSADGLSLTFIVIWLLGDVFNILGAVLQGVLPTMIILAVYYTAADIVLLGQCFYYRGWTPQRRKNSSSALEDEEGVRRGDDDDDEQSALLPHSHSHSPTRPRLGDIDRAARGSISSIQSYLSDPHVDATHLSPATPFVPPSKPTSAPPPAAGTLKPRSPLTAVLFNTTALILVCAAGVLGWWLSTRSSSVRTYPHSHHDPPPPHNPTSSSSSSSSSNNNNSNSSLHIDLLGQIFGYLCAILYLGSRVPQLLLNRRRKSTAGISTLFFLFACAGNLSYVLSIFAHEPACAGLEAVGDSSRPSAGAGTGTRATAQGGGCEEGEWTEAYGRYILLNASWIAGSAGTLVLDLMIFGQVWRYRERGAGEV